MAEKNKLTSLSFPVGSIITEEHVQNLTEEAKQFPVGSTYWKCFINYAGRLEKRLQEQKKIDNN
jgi:hypothetical protein